MVASVLASGARAQQAIEAEPAALGRVMGELARVRHAKARFVERKYLEMLKAPLELTGTLEYRAPDRLEKRTLTPKPESFVVEGNRLELENARGQRRRVSLQEHAVLWGFVESIRSTLKGDLPALHRFYHVAFDGRTEAWRLTLTPRDPKMAAIISQIQIEGAAARVASVEIQEARGDRSVMTVIEETP
jgi:hypothetical protein